MPRLRSLQIVLIGALLCPTVSAMQERERLAPPAAIKCPHNKLTVFAGRVQSFSVRDEKARLVIATDWDTVETVLLPATRENQLPLFLYKGEPFSREHLRDIFVDKDEVRPGTRAHAWVCRDATFPPLIDWQSPRETP